MLRRYLSQKKSTKIILFSLVYRAFIIHGDLLALRILNIFKILSKKLFHNTPYSGKLKSDISRMVSKACVVSAWRILSLFRLII